MVLVLEWMRAGPAQGGKDGAKIGERLRELHHLEATKEPARMHLEGPKPIVMEKER